MLGFLRVITNRKAMNDLPMTPDLAWKSYHSYRQLPDVVFLPESGEAENQLMTWTDDAKFAVKRWTDAYLAAFAYVSGCRIVSFDSDFKHFGGLSFLHLKL